MNIQNCVLTDEMLKDIIGGQSEDARRQGDQSQNEFSIGKLHVK